jgi:hypothetical protein
VEPDLGAPAPTSLDLRTRRAADIPAFDTATFLDRELPDLIAERSGLAVPGATELGVESLTVTCDSGDWTLALDGGRLSVRRGDEGAARVRLTDDRLADLVHDVATPMTLLTGGTLDMPRGDLGDLLDWFVVLRSLVDGRPVHTAGSVAFAAPDGGPLDLTTGFPPDADDAEILHFLRQAGFLHLTGWFTEEEMAAVSHDIDVALPAYSEGDGRSWWAGTADGTRRCVRLQGFDEHSPTTAALLDDDRFQRIGRLIGDGHRNGPGRNRVEALEKPIGVVDGISDVPWHKDCSLGLHSYECCRIVVGISVTGADASSGQLRVVAGSHRTLVQPAFVRREWGLPIVDLPTRTGDLTVHTSCTLHMAQPPVDRERRVLYTDFGLPRIEDDAEALADRHRSLRRVREASYRTVSQAPAG